MHVQPLNSQVLLRPIDAAARTAGGLYLPETAREEPAEGVIEALPPGNQDEIAVGDRVLYKKHAGEEITLDGRRMRLVPMDDLQLKIVEADAIA